MTKRLAGVALAAVMACGWAGAARASTINFDYYYDRGSREEGETAGPVSGMLEVVGGLYTLSFRFDYTTSPGVDINGDPLGPDQNGVETGGAKGSVNIISSSPGEYILANFGNSTLGFQALFYFYKQAFSSPLNAYAYFSYGTNNTFADFGSGLRTSGGLLASDFVAPVPLPSSAPLFGAALLALGGASYARRRRSQG